MVVASTVTGHSVFNFIPMIQLFGESEKETDLILKLTSTGNTVSLLFCSTSHQQQTGNKPNEHKSLVCEES